MFNIRSPARIRGPIFKNKKFSMTHPDDSFLKLITHHIIHFLTHFSRKNPCPKTPPSHYLLL